MRSLPFPRSTLLVLSSNVVRLGLGFGVSLLLAASMEPAEYGAFSLLMGVLLTAAALSDLGINIPFVRFYVQQHAAEQEASRDFASFVLGWRFWLSAAAMAMAAVFIVVSGEAYVQRPLPGWSMVVGAVLVLSEGLSAFFIAFLQARRQFRQLSFLVVQPNVLRVIGLGVASLAGSVTLTMAFLIFAGSLMLNMVVGRYFTRDIRPDWLPFSRSRNFRTQIAWTKWTFIQTVSNVLVSKFDLLALGAYAIGRDVVGSYALGLAFGSIIVAMQSSVMTVLLPQVSALQTVEDTRRYRQRSIQLTIAMAVASGLAMASGWWLLSTFFSASYPDAPTLFLAIAAGFTVSALVTPWTTLSYALNRPEIPAFQNLIAMIVLGTSSLLLVPAYGALGMGASVFLSRLSSEGWGVSWTLWKLRHSPLAGPHPAGSDA